MSLSGFIKLLLLVASSMFGFIYWVGLPGSFKYIVYFLIAILFFWSIKLPNYNIGVKKIIITYIILLAIISTTYFGINGKFIQSIIGIIFLFLPLLVFLKLYFSEKRIINFANFLCILVFSQLLIMTYQKFVLKNPVDLISGFLGRSESTTIAILFSFVIAIALGNLYYIKKRKNFHYLLIILSFYAFVICEAKAGFIFSIVVASSIIFFPKLKSKFNFKTIFFVSFVIALSLLSIKHILPQYLDNELALRMLENPESRYEYYNENYSDRYVRGYALKSVWGDYLNQPVNLAFGNGLGYFSTSSYYESSSDIQKKQFLYSMSSECVIYLIERGVVGTFIFIFIVLYFIFISFKNSRYVSSNFEKFLCYLSFSLGLIMLISFIFYTRPFRSIILTVIYWGILSIVLKYKYYKTKLKPVDTNFNTINCVNNADIVYGFKKWEK